MNTHLEKHPLGDTIDDQVATSTKLEKGHAGPLTLVTEKEVAVEHLDTPGLLLPCADTLLHPFGEAPRPILPGLELHAEAALHGCSPTATRPGRPLRHQNLGGALTEKPEKLNPTSQPVQTL